MKFVLMMASLLAFAHSEAYAVRNMNTVIAGKLYISGSSGGRSPLNQQHLTDLCDQGFTYVAYVYAGGSNKTVTCGGGRQLKYQNATNWKNPASILSEATQAIASGGKALVHCWNGVHASRFVGAVALTQKCGFSGPEAAKWWRSGFSPASLGASATNELFGRLSRLPSGQAGTSGCPAPR